jgi:hypothetical protein
MNSTRMDGRSAVQCSAVQCSAVQCSAVQCSAVQCSADNPKPIRGVSPEWTGVAEAIQYSAHTFTINVNFPI